MAHEVRVRGVRGATTADENTREAMLAATRELLELMIAANGLEPADVVSAIFTTTIDLNADYPALAARALAPKRADVISLAHLHAPAVNVRDQAMLIVDRLRRASVRIDVPLVANAWEPA